MIREDGWIEVSFPAESLPGGAGLRLDVFLSRRIRASSRAAAAGLIRAGRVSLRGKTAKASAKVAAGDTVVVIYPRRPDPPASRSALGVIHEDADLLVVDKPGGVLSHPTDKIRANSATEILAAQFPGTRLHLVHRLDKETSGVLLLAKNPDSARLLQGQFARRAVEKAYFAIVRGKLDRGEFLVDSPLIREGGEIKVRQRVARPGETGARTAMTAFSAVGTREGATAVLARPRTGRLHQIRVHLSSIGHPVLGDKLYTGSGSFYLKAVRRELGPADLVELGADRQLLHALRLSLAHPRTGTEVSFTAPIPEDMRIFSKKSDDPMLDNLTRDLYTPLY